MPATSIGRIVAELRTLKGWTQEQLANACDPPLTQQYISQVEAGRRAVAKRSTIIRLADALQVAPAELLGQPLPISTRTDLLAVSSVAAIRAALDYPDEPPVPRQRHDLTVAANRVLLARMECDYPALSAGLPTLLGEALAAYADTDGHWAGVLVVRAAVCASLTLRPIGWQDLATRLAELARRVASEVADPDLVAAADFCYAQCLLSSGSRRRSYQVAAGAAAAIDPSYDGARVMVGMLHLHAGLSAASMSDMDTAEGHFGEAEAVARVPIAHDPWLMEFNPDNINTWRVGAALENGSPEQAPLIAQRVDPRNLRTRQRRSRLLTDAGRGLYLDNQQERAIRAFLRAAEIAPDEVRTRPSVREITGQMLRDARGGGSEELRLLADRIGVAA